MINFLRFDFSKLSRMPAFYIFIFVTFCFFNVMNLVFYSGNQSYEDYKQQYEQNHQETADDKNQNDNFEFSLNYYDDGQALLTEEEFQIQQDLINQSYAFDQTLYTDMMNYMALGIIFFAIFVANDFSTGYLKNLLSLSGARWKWVCSKIPLALIFGVICLILSVLSGLMSHVVSINESISINWHDFFIYFVLMEIGLVLGMAGISFIILWTQNKTTTIVIGSIIGMGIYQQVLQVLSRLSGLDFTDLSYASQVGQLGFELDGAIWPVILQGLIGILLLWGLNLYRSHKMDFNFSD